MNRSSFDFWRSANLHSAVFFWIGARRSGINGLELTPLKLLLVNLQGQQVGVVA